MIPLLVLAVGNRILGDDGLGARALEALAGAGLPPGTRLVDGGTDGLALLPAIEDAERLIVVDAIDLGLAPGALRRLVGEEIPLATMRPFSPHEVGLGDLLALCGLRDTTPREVVAWGVQVAHTGVGVHLSPAVEAALPRLVASVLEEARRMLAAAVA
jgi:hydrogenase maturation protease